MDRLPREIVLLIIKDFTYKEKLVCALVCQKWLIWIRNSSLYKTLRFLDDWENLQKAIHYFEHHNYGNQVANLEILDCSLDLDLVITLPGLFPNLKEFKFAEKVDSEEVHVTRIEQCRQDKQIQQWKKLEVINEMNSRLCPVTLALLRSPNNVRLTSISLNLLKADRNNNPSKDLLRLIPNAPTLQSITVDCIVLSIQDIDFLLKSTPQLKTLVFTNYNTYDNTEVVSEDEDNEEVDFSHPRNNIQNVSIDFSSMVLELEIDQLIDYFSMYTSIVSLSMLSTDLLPPMDTTDHIESSLINAFSSWNQLKKYNMGWAPLTEPILQAMADNRIEIEDITLYTRFNLQTNLLGSSSQAHKLRSLHIIGNADDFLDDLRGSLLRPMDQLVNLDMIKFACMGDLRENDPNLIAHLIDNAPNVKKMIIPRLTREPLWDYPLSTRLTSQLTHLDISYCQFDLSIVDINAINTSFENALQYCPYLESFKSYVNIYKSSENTAFHGDTLKFRFNNQRSLKEIKIWSLYGTFFKIIRNGNTDYYRQNSHKKLEEIDHIDKNCVYITIETDDKAIIETIVLDG